MKTLKKILIRIICISLAPILLYCIISVFCSIIPVHGSENQDKRFTIYLQKKEMHLDIILPKENIQMEALEETLRNTNTKYLSFGWGDKSFYTTPVTMSELSFLDLFHIVVLPSSSALHVTQLTQKQKNWIPIQVSKNQMEKINALIYNSFEFNNKELILLPGLGYSKNDDFYDAKGNYTCFNTCNSWVNNLLKKSDIKACLWTPYHFGPILMHKTKSPAKNP